MDNQVHIDKVRVCLTPKGYEYWRALSLEVFIREYRGTGTMSVKEAEKAAKQRFSAHYAKRRMSSNRDYVWFTSEEFREVFREAREVVATFREYTSRHDFDVPPYIDTETAYPLFNRVYMPGEPMAD